MKKCRRGLRSACFQWVQKAPHLCHAYSTVLKLLAFFILFFFFTGTTNEPNPIWNPTQLIPLIGEGWRSVDLGSLECFIKVPHPPDNSVIRSWEQLNLKLGQTGFEDIMSRFTVPRGSRICIHERLKWRVVCNKWGNNFSHQLTGAHFPLTIMNLITPSHGARTLFPCSQMYASILSSK
jgi:hypothetical protein